MAISDYYTSTITRKVATSVADNMGGYTLTWNTSGSTFTGRINALSLSEQIINEQRKSVTTHILYTDASNTITVTDRLVIGSTTYEVLSIKTPQDRTSNHHLEVELKVVT